MPPLPCILMLNTKQIFSFVVISSLTHEESIRTWCRNMVTCILISFIASTEETENVAWSSFCASGDYNNSTEESMNC